MIRPYRPADFDALVEITIRAFDGVSIDQNIERRFGPINGVGWEERKGRHLERDVTANPRGVLVYEEDGGPAGFVACRFDRRTAIGWIPNLAVHPDHQGRGIGRRLMEAALDYLREQGMRFVRIETLEQNARCAAFYPRLGFQEVGRQIHYILPLGSGS
ncbi:MAG: GNAT family N-acetyltransferase [Candidatus Brocadiia bacterium]